MRPFELYYKYHRHIENSYRVFQRSAARTPSKDHQKKSLEEQRIGLCEDEELGP